MVPTQVLKESELFSGLEDGFLQEIASLCREEIFERGAVIFREGQEGDALYLLQEGLVTLRIHPPGHEDLIAATVRRRGEVFGWSALVEQRRLTVSAVCLERSRVVVIKGPELLALLEREPARGLAIMRRLADIITSRLRETRLQLTSALSTGLISHG